MPRQGGSPQRPAVFFDDADELRAWLRDNHATASELWLGLTARHVVPRGLTYEQALPEALCFGWIDSVRQRIDDDASRQRWTPRRRGSNWSTVNVRLAERLVEQGRMQPAGLAAFQARQADRTGSYSYERDAGVLPPEYAQRLAASPRAALFWHGATPSYRRGCVHWVLSAKQPATQERRLAQLVAECEAGRLVAPFRFGAEPVWAHRLRDRLDGG